MTSALKARSVESLISATGGVLGEGGVMVTFTGWAFQDAVFTLFARRPRHLPVADRGDGI